MNYLQALMARYGDHTPGLMGARKNYAVLCPFVERGGEPHLIFEVRAQGLRQAGEVCFPGGAMEKGESAAACALRETFEELGIPPEEITLFGESDFMANQENFLLRPVLGLVSQKGFSTMHPSQAEVAEVFTVPVIFFRETEPFLYHYDLTARVPEDFPYDLVGIARDYAWRGGKVSVPIWVYEGHVIWGMTGRVLRDILKE